MKKMDRDKYARGKHKKARVGWAKGKMTSVMIGLSVERAYSDEPGLEPSPSPRNISVDGIGSGFHKGLLQVGATVGAGFGVEVFGGTLAHDLARRQRMLAGYLRV